MVNPAVQPKKTPAGALRGKGLRRFFVFLLCCGLLIPAGGQTAPAAPDTPAAPERWDRDSLLAAALGGNSAYLLAASRGREAQALFSTAKAARLPVIRFSSNLSYLTNPPSLTLERGSLHPGENIPLTVPIPSPIPGMPTPPVTTQFPFPALPDEDITFNLSQNTRYEFGLTLEQPVFTWGRIHNSVKAADLGSQAAAMQIEQERRNIQTALDSHLYTLAFLGRIRELLAEQSRRAERLIAISEESYANGFLLRSDLMEARLVSAEVHIGDLGIAEAWDNSFLALKTMTGIPDLRAANITLPPLGSGEGEDRESLGFSPADLDRLLDRLHGKNLGLQLLSLQTRIRERTLDAAKGQYYGKPELGLFLQLTYGGPAFPFIQENWQDDNDLNFTVTMGIRSLLFDGGAVHQTIRQKEENLIQARLEAEQGRRNLGEYLEKTLRQLEVSRYRQEYLALKIEAGAIQKDQAETAWKNGSGEEREYLIRELSWYQDRITLLQEALSALLTALQLENVLGN
jgi:outer membrane protein TolC